MHFLSVDAHNEIIRLRQERVNQTIWFNNEKLRLEERIKSLMNADKADKEGQRAVLNEKNSIEEQLYVQTSFNTKVTGDIEKLRLRNRELEQENSSLLAEKKQPSNVDYIAALRKENRELKIKIEKQEEKNSNIIRQKRKLEKIIENSPQ